MGSKQVESVYCDFTKQTNDPGKKILKIATTIELFTDQLLIGNLPDVYSFSKFHRLHRR